MEPRRRFTDPRSKIAWAAIKTLDESLQYQLLMEWDTELEFAVENPRTPEGDRDALVLLDLVVFPAVDLDVWVKLSSFVHVTVSPAWTSITFGAKT